jgi:hypothetical protein
LEVEKGALWPPGWAAPLLLSHRPWWWLVGRLPVVLAIPYKQGAIVWSPSIYAEISNTQRG